MRSGNSSRHGSHHVAQKFMSSGLPFGLSRFFKPSASICVTFGKFETTLFGATLVFLAGTFDFVCFRACPKESLAERNTTQIKNAETQNSEEFFSHEQTRASTKNLLNTFRACSCLFVAKYFSKVSAFLRFWGEVII